MEYSTSHIKSLVQLAFWRSAATITGLAVRKKSLLQRTLMFAPVVIASALAYMLGWFFGELLLKAMPF
jgi:hypothetical protein